MSVIRSHLVDGVDKHGTEHISTLSEMMGYLFRRYGTESSVFQSMLTEILNLPHPKNEKDEEVNLAKISALTSISTTDNNKELYTMDRVKVLINNTLTDKSKELFWNTFLQCKCERIYSSR